MALALSGLGIGDGIAIGAAHILNREIPEVPEYYLPPEAREKEIRRFRLSLERARNQLQAVRERIPPGTRADIADFIDAHLLMLADSALSQVPVAIIRERGCNAEWALKQQCDDLCSVFDEMEDPYLATRRDDVVHVVTRVQRILVDGDNGSELHGETGQESPELPLKGKIVLAEDLTPADMIVLQHQGIAGFVTEYGGPLSHTAILARNLRIPAIVGAHSARRYLHDGEMLVLDSSTGVVLQGLEDPGFEEFHYRQLQDMRQRESLHALRAEPAISRDGHTIALRANIELLEDAHAARENGADGVGLYRTEFLFMNRSDTPDEEEHFRTYRSVIEALDGQPLTIRTLDLGADKPLATDRSVPTNPALGLRAVRLCLKEPELFMPQLRAILRASIHGQVRILIPMISTLREIQQVRALIRTAREELERAGHPIAPDIPLGAMIEVPAAALAAHRYARELDFLSIGTNDLIQYTLAIDRVDDEVNYLYDPMHPAVIRLLNLTLEAARSADIPVSLCGEMASDPRYTRFLLALGLREFSMHPASLLDVKKVVTETSIEELGEHVSRLLHTEDEGEAIRVLLEALNTA
ncbi:MAG: phosphoenolpyruvate--protein phosphotransferase [Gammaproteobacteria bacterium]